MIVKESIDTMYEKTSNVIRYGDTIPYYTILYYTILYYTVLFYRVDLWYPQYDDARVAITAENQFVLRCSPA